MTNDDYAIEQQALAATWKKRTPVLWPAARQPAAWINQYGKRIGNFAHCLPPEHAQANLLPENYEAIELFEDLRIPWHCGVGNGPGNNLLSSQVQCVNALMPMVHDPARIARAFGGVVDISEVLQIEPDRYLTFEYIGPTDYFNEGAGKARVRGTRCTSVDAAFLYRTSTGTIELALVEWKYTEKYSTTRKPNPGYDTTRIERYGADYHDPTGPLHSGLIDIEWMLDEPFYQLMRQQLLAWRLEQDAAEGADRVRVLHVLPAGNHAYQESLVRPEHRVLGASVDEVWSNLLRAPNRFRHVDPAVFLDQSITSWDYVDRYSPNGTGDLPQGVSIWRDDDRIVAATYVYNDGFEWCHRPTLHLEPPPRDRTELAALPDREYFSLFDDEKTMIVGPLEYARAFLRALVATGLYEPDGLTSYSWPDQVSQVVSTWPPLDLEHRFGI